MGLHLDGARINMASGYTKVSVNDYCSLFDTAERNSKKIKAHLKIYAARQQIEEHIF